MLIIKGRTDWVISKTVPAFLRVKVFKIPKTWLFNVF